MTRMAALTAALLLLATSCGAWRDGAQRAATEHAGTIAVINEDGTAVLTVKPDGTGLRRVTPERRRPYSFCCAEWSPNGRLLAYSYFTEGFSGNGIFIVHSDGSGRRRLTNATAYYDVVSSWAPDSRRLAFDRNIDADHSIWVVPVDDGDPQEISKIRPFDNHSAAWSPDGRHIAFTGRRGMWLIAPDGRGKRRITGSRLDSAPVWAPDGRRIAFLRSGLWLMNADGTHQRSLVQNPASRDIGQHVWSPDGRKIAFMLGDADREIWLVPVNGGAPRKLTNNERVQDSCPAWSPDGRTIAFTSDRSGRTEIYLMNANGTRERKLGLVTAKDECPVWSPGG